MTLLQNYINGRFYAPSGDNYLDLTEPATGSHYASVPDSSPADVDLAVQSAASAFFAWSSGGPIFRSQWLYKLADAIESNLDMFAEAESKDTGKPLSVARSVDIPRAVANFRFFAGAILHDSSDAHVDRPWTINYTVRHPLGVVGCISPWNLPLYLFSWKIAPALAAGNCVVGKPSEVTPYTAFLLSEICHEIGFPAGVLNIVHGSGPQTGAALVDHPGVKAISFTGGTSTGKMIAQSAAIQLKKVSLELGGKNPTIIFADADLEVAADAAIEAAFSNQGQICLCGSRILIERSVYDHVKALLVKKASNMKVGDPKKDTTRIGALVSHEHMDKVMGHIDLATQEGGTVLTGGRRLKMKGRCASGNFLAPTLIEGLSASCATNQTEIFGPVATLLPFDSEQEAITLANDSRYGLSASVWTADLNTANRVSDALSCGMVWVNCWMVRDLRTPFGGVKESGVGREGGTYALRFFTETKNVCIKTQ